MVGPKANVSNDSSCFITMHHQHVQVIRDRMYIYINRFIVIVIVMLAKRSVDSLGRMIYNTHTHNNITDPL